MTTIKDFIKFVNKKLGPSEKEIKMIENINLEEFNTKTYEVEDFYKIISANIEKTNESIKKYKRDNNIELQLEQYSDALIGKIDGTTDIEPKTIKFKYLSN